MSDIRSQADDDDDDDDEDDDQPPHREAPIMDRYGEVKDSEEDRSMEISSVFGSVTGSRMTAGDEKTAADETVGLTPGELRRLGDVFGQSFGSGSGSSKGQQSATSATQQAKGQDQQQSSAAKLFDSPSSSQNLPPITFTQYSDDSKQGDESPAGSGSQEGQQRRISFAPSTKPGVVLPVETANEADEGGGLLSLITNPMEYIFGGADDEVSEMGGTFFNDASSLWGGESQSKSLGTKLSLQSANNTARETPAASVADKASTFSFAPSRGSLVTSIREPIYEVDEESSTQGSSRASGRTPRHTSFSVGGISRAAEEKSIASQSNVKFRTTEDVSVASRSFAGSRVRDDRSTGSFSHDPNVARDDRSVSSQSFAPSRGQGAKSVSSQSFSSPRPQGDRSIGSQLYAPSFRDTDSVARSQAPGSLASGFRKSGGYVGSDEYSMGSFVKKEMSDSNSKTTSLNTDSFGSSSHVGDYGTESVAYNSAMGHNGGGYDAETHRQGSILRDQDENTFYESQYGGFDASQSFAGAATGSDGYPYDPRSAMLQPSAAARSTRSMASTGSEVFKLHPDGPVMTRSPSGRAVVHVALRSDREGSINKLEYTSPQVQPEPLFQDEPDYTTVRDRSVRSQYRSVADGDSYSYYYKQNPVPPASHRKWARIQAMIFLLALAAAAVTVATFSSIGNGDISRSISTTSQVVSAPSAGSNSQGPPTPRSSPSAPASPTSPSLPTAPVPAYAPGKTNTRVKLPEPLASRITDWVTTSGKIPDITKGIPFYWSFPLGGAALLQYVFGACFGFTQASEVGAAWASNGTLGIVQVGGDNYVNVDTTTIQGLEHAAAVELVPSKIANIVYSPFLYEAIQTLYNSQNPARLIVTLRHPVDYAVALLQYLQTHPSDPRYSSSLKTMTIDAFATSGYLSNNIYTRALVNKMAGGLTGSDLELAKSILRQKAIVGTYDDLPGAMRRIESYFQFSTAGKIGNCSSALLENVLATQHVSPLDTGSTAYALIEQRNQYDIKLYNYIATVLVPHQDQFLASQASTSSG